MAGSVINIAIVTYVLSGIYPTISLLVWFFVGEILNLIRWGVHLGYVRHTNRFSTHTWLQLHRLFTGLSGCLYGVLAVFFFSSEYPLYQALVIFLVGGMGAAAVGTHSADRLTYLLFLLSSTIPLIIRSFLEYTEVHTTLSVMLCLLILIMLRSAKQTREILTDNFDMAYSLHYRATHDGLVGLLNRDEFQNIFAKDALVNAASDSESVTSIIFIDLDNFKTLNDTFGHQAGDEALIKVGEIIRSSIRKSDIAARFGGDEFMILIRSASVEQAEMIAQKILNKIKAFQHELDHSDAILGASMGIGFSNAADVEFETLLKAADQACYKAKTEQRGSVCLQQVA